MGEGEVPAVTWVAVSFEKRWHATRSCLPDWVPSSIADGGHLVHAALMSERVEFTNAGASMRLPAVAFLSSRARRNSRWSSNNV